MNQLSMSIAAKIAFDKAAIETFVVRINQLEQSQISTQQPSDFLIEVNCKAGVHGDRYSESDYAKLDPFESAA